MGFATCLRLLAPVAVFVGCLHLVLGLGADALLGAHLPPGVMADPVLDSQNRFYGVSFMIYGALLWVCASDVRRYAPVFRLVAAFLFLGGVARVVAMALHGAPSVQVLGLLAIELVAPPLLLVWQRATLAR